MFGFTVVVAVTRWQLSSVFVLATELTAPKR